MSLLSAQIISAITAGIFALAIGAPLVRRRIGNLPVTPTGIATAGFDKNDILIAGFLLLFYGISPLSAFSTAQTSQPDASSTEVMLTAGKIFAGILLQSLVLLAIIVRLASKNIRGQVGWNRYLSWKHGGLIVGAAMATFLFFYVMQATGISTWISQTTDSSISQDSVKQLQHGTTGVKITLAISAVLFAPFLEELAFRGYLYPVCKKLMGPILACIVTSLLFGIVHMNLVVFLPLSLFGALLVVIYERTKSIWVPIAAHVIFNMVTVVNILFSSTNSLL